MGSTLYQLRIVQAGLCTSGRLSAIPGLCACLWIQGGRVWRKFWRLSSTYISPRECGWRTKFFWWVMTLVPYFPHALTCCRTADYLQCEEFAYNVRYVENHGWDLENPWSVRHMAVYHQFDAEKKSSNWILLHPSAAVRQQLEKVVSEVACAGPADRRFLHLIFLWSTEKNWRDYVNYLENEFKALVCTFLWAALLGGHPRRFY